MGGSMRQRGKDSWNLRVFVGWDPVAKQRSYLERTVRGTRREASTALAALVLEAERLSPGAPRQGTVGALCEEWLARATSSLSPRTVVSTRGYLDQAILPALGHVQAARLTAATRLLTSGIDVRTVAGRLVHRNPSTTLNVYAHFLPGSDRDASAALARVLEDARKWRPPKVARVRRVLIREVLRSRDDPS
jgi:integrase